MKNPGYLLKIFSTFEFEIFLILPKLIGVLLLFRAPTDCLQYYTTTSGEIKSFNFGSGLMTNLRYDVCIRESVGKNYNILRKYFNFYLVCLFVTEETYYSITAVSRQGSLAKPLSLLFLTSRLGLSSHQHRTLVCLF